MDIRELAQQVEEKYRRYLKTTFYFKDPDLRTSFEEALQSWHLSKGLFIEATPVFKRTTTPRDLFTELLGRVPEQGLLEAVLGERPLYYHQEQAVRQIFGGKNVVIATGTGSGKTEAFLLPVLLQLYREYQAGILGPGVRALILYPMNALANDQRDRLGEICSRLAESRSPFRFTFGQYIGETPKDKNDTRRHASSHEANRLPGELVFRTEMWNEPPHILLTNYSMLEYLLLRPEDSALFDRGRARWWRFIILDEAHQYRGSRGIEMAMLLRRLKQRLREGGRNDTFQCIATSATLAGGGDDCAAVAKFASDLFNESFDQTNLIMGETEPFSSSSSHDMTPDQYLTLKEALETKVVSSSLVELAKRLGIASLEEEIEKVAGKILQQDGRALRLYNQISVEPVELEEIAVSVFDDSPEELRVEHLLILINLLLKAEFPISGAPLLSARYHLFLRSLEGAFVTYYPYKKVYLDRKLQGENTAAFEVALCRECGQHYFVGPKNFQEGKLGEAVRDPSHPEFGATFFRPLDDEIVSDEEWGNNNTSNHGYVLCMRCGKMSRSQPDCGHLEIIPIIREESPTDEDRADQMARCGACGYNAAGRDPVREVVHGTDGPHAVISTTLYQNLPDGRKKILAFADSRQEAAFFAWYLEDSYKSILNRNIILKVVHQLDPFSGEGLTLKELIIGLLGFYRNNQLFPSAAGNLELLREGWLSVYREFLTDEIRLSLEGVGLTRWALKLPEWQKVPDVFLRNPWTLSEQEARDLFFLLLDYMRIDKAVELHSDGIIPLHWDDLGFQSPQMRFQIGPPGRRRGVRSWDGITGRRASFLAKLLVNINENLKQEEALTLAVSSLREVWEQFRRLDEEAPAVNNRLLLPVEDGLRLNPDWWRIEPITRDDTLFQCDTCGRIFTVSIRATCPRHRCNGTLNTITAGDLQPNHYRQLYQEEMPWRITVEEHTAQLSYEKARQYQKDFKKGNIHVLSCSTTFELGVDLGDLDMIFLRNVPPEAFNYAQRVGRAGRRQGFPGFAVTYCRRGPHDLYHFAVPNQILKGAVRPPALSIRNEKIITRHILAATLSCFFRAHPERFVAVQGLLKDMEKPEAVPDFSTFLKSHQHSLESMLSSIIPKELFDRMGIRDGGWIGLITGDGSHLSLAEAEASSDYCTAKKVEESAVANMNYGLAIWAKNRRSTISSEDVLSFLSRKAVIPKYGFPVDLVSLDTQGTEQNRESFDIQLQRDLSLAISEFAPTSKLVANKKLWTSYGLKRVAEKVWVIKSYKKCLKHNVFLQWELGEPEPATPCGEALSIYQYIIPRFGFVTSSEKPKDPTSRTTRVFSSRPFFAGPLGSDPGSINIPGDNPLLTLKKASPGRMVVLCEGKRGEGFYICQACGAGFRKMSMEHKTPYGDNCRSTLYPFSLGHEFITDVLQLQFHLLPREETELVWFAYSLAYALVEGAAGVLEAPANDLSATVAHGLPGSIPPIILYDNVPGGAGFVSRLEDKKMLIDALEAARNRVSGNCGCGENDSCYGCLRNYRNQFAHRFLNRGMTLQYLEKVLLDLSK